MSEERQIPTAGDEEKSPTATSTGDPTSGNHTHTPARESAVQLAAASWLFARPECLTQALTILVVEGFAAGAAWAADQWDDESRIGQRQLDDARSLIEETAGLLRGYEDHHWRKLDRIASRNASAAVLAVQQEKIDRNRLAAERLEGWLVGSGRYPTSSERPAGGPGIRLSHSDALGLLDALDAGDLHTARDAIAALVGRRKAEVAGELAEADGYVAVWPDQLDRAARAAAEGPNVRDVSDQLLQDPALIGAMLGEPIQAEGTFSTATPLALKTQDPLFDPRQPVTINGFEYRPTTTED